jgi:hypothetical protein
MEYNYGKAIYKSISNVVSFHNDCHVLLNESDKLFPDSVPVFGNTVTRDLTRSITWNYWMAEGLYRAS